MTSAPTENTDNNPLGSVPINILLARFAIPSIIAMLVSALYNIVDQCHQCGVSPDHHLYCGIPYVRDWRFRQL